MRIIIFHYHLNPGGVTRIIDLQTEALKMLPVDIPILLATGNCTDVEKYINKGIKVIVNPELDYLNNENEFLNEQYNKIFQFLKDLCCREDILHFHNLNLGKNPLLTLAVYKLACEGFNVVNHTHDFSEDRLVNQNFLKSIIENISQVPLQKVMYPNLNNYLFAVLNTFDLNRLYRIGVETERCFLLPNPVFPDENNKLSDCISIKNNISEKLGLDKSKLIITYPVRVIHRKNIAEFILFSALFSDKANWLVTQPPKNPIEITEYIKWKEFCAKENIPIIWEAGNKVDFDQLIQISDYCITTSIREGFGMVFLEPWLLGTPVIGRELPMATNDLKKAGIHFPFLYSRFYIEEDIEIYDLSLEKQMDIIRELKNSAKFSDKLLKLNPHFNNFPIRVNLTLIDKNKDVILKEYSLEKYGKRLNEIYRRFIKRA